MNEQDYFNLSLQCYHTHNLDKKNMHYLLHAVHRTIPGGQQIDCILRSIVHKSNLPEDFPSMTSSSFMAVLHWISFSCGMHIAVNFFPRIMIDLL